MLYIGLGMFSYGGVQAITAPIASFLGSKHTGFSIIAIVSGFLLAGFTFILAFCHGSIAAVVVLLALIGGACSGCNVSICSMVIDYTTAEDYGSISGSMALFQTLGSGIGSVAANQIRLSKYVMQDGVKVATDMGYKITFIIMGAFLVLSFGLSFVYPDKLHACRKKKPANKEEVELMDPEAAISSTSVSPQPEIGLSSKSTTPTPAADEKKSEAGVTGEIKITVNESNDSSDSSSSSGSNSSSSNSSESSEKK